MLNHLNQMKVTHLGENLSPARHRKAPSDHEEKKKIEEGERVRGGGRRRRAEFTELGWSVSRSRGGSRGGALGGESLSKRIGVGLREKKIAESQPVEFVWYRNKRLNSQKKDLKEIATGSINCLIKCTRRLLLSWKEITTW